MRALWLLLTLCACAAEPEPQRARAVHDNPAPGTRTPMLDSTHGRAQLRPAADTLPSTVHTVDAAVEVRRPELRPVLLRAVRAAEHPAWERTVFEFDGAEVPGYRVEYLEPPVRQCGSGRPVQLQGEGVLQVRLTPAQAHTNTGEPTIAERERRPALRNLRELEMSCDFEGQVTWVLGLRHPERFRVTELAAPARLVVDILR